MVMADRPHSIDLFLSVRSRAERNAFRGIMMTSICTSKSRGGEVEEHGCQDVNERG